MPRFMSGQTPKFVTEESMVTAMRALELQLDCNLRELAQDAFSDERIGMLVFYTMPGRAFDQFPISVSAWTAEGREVESRIWEHEILPERTLLPTDESYPLGRVDWLGVDTTRDFELVDRVLKDGLSRCWTNAVRSVQAPKAFVLTMHDDATDGPQIAIDLITGEDQVISLHEAI